MVCEHNRLSFVSLSLSTSLQYCVTKGNNLVRASLFFCLSDAFLSLNLTSERCFSTTLAEWPLFRRHFSNFFIFSLKVNFEEFFLRSLNASPLIKPFVTPGDTIKNSCIENSDHYQHLWTRPYINRGKFKDLTPYIIQQTHDPLYNSCFLRKGYLNYKHHATID